MKKTTTILILLIGLTAPINSYAQHNLCKVCALKILNPLHPTRCCENCLRDYYVTELKKNITTVQLCSISESKNCDSLLSFPDTISGIYRLESMQSAQGYQLINNEKLIFKTYYLMNMYNAEDSITHNDLMVIITDDSSAYDYNKFYELLLRPYFDKDQNTAILNGERCFVVGSLHTLFDLIYKNWLIAKIPLGINYFFVYDE